MAFKRVIYPAYCRSASNISFEHRQIFGMMGQMFSTLNRRGKGEKEGRKGGKEKEEGDRAKAAGIQFSLVCKLYSAESAKLRHGRMPSVYT